MATKGSQNNTIVTPGFDYRALYAQGSGHKIKQSVAMEWERISCAWITSFSSTHTQNTYRRALQEFQAFLMDLYGIEHLWLVSGEHAREWRKYMEGEGSALLTLKPYTIATINNRMAAISSFYRHTREQTIQVDGNDIPMFTDARGRLKENPFSPGSVKRPKQIHYKNAQVIHYTILEAMFQQIRAKEDRKLSDLRDYAFLLTCYRTGWKAKEVLCLKWGQIMQNTHGRTNAYSGLHHSSHKVIPAHCYEAIEEYLIMDGRLDPEADATIEAEEYIWRPLEATGNNNLYRVHQKEKNDNRHICLASAREIFNRRLNHLFIEQLREKTGQSVREVRVQARDLASQYTLYSLRHTYAQQLHRVTGSATLVQRQLSHSSEEVTKLYLEGLQEPTDDLSELLAANFGI